jgi:hypothetical protein
MVSTENTGVTERPARSDPAGECAGRTGIVIATMTCALLLAGGRTAGAQSPTPSRAEPQAWPGAKLVLVEIVRTSPVAGEGFSYRLQATGLPRDKAFRLVVRHIGGSVVRVVPATR